MVRLQPGCESGTDVKETTSTSTAKGGTPPQWNRAAPARRCGSKSIDRCSSLRYPHIDRTPHASRKIGAPRGGIFCPGISHDPITLYKPSLSLRPSSTPCRPWDDCQHPGFRGKKPSPHRIRASQFLLETLRIIDTGQTRESLRVGDGETYRVVCAAEHYNGNRDCPPTRTDRDRAGHIITPILPVPHWTLSPAVPASTCSRPNLRVQLRPAGAEQRGRPPSQQGKTGWKAATGKPHQHPSTKGTPKAEPTKRRPESAPPKLKPGRVVASTTAEGTRHRSAGIKNGSLPKKSGVRPKLLDSAGLPEPRDTGQNPLLHLRQEAPGVTTALRGKKPDGQSIVSPTPKRQQSEQATQAPHFIRRSG